MNRFEIRLRIRIPEFTWKHSIGGRLNAANVAEWVQDCLVIGFDRIPVEAIEVVPIPDDE